MMVFLVSGTTKRIASAAPACGILMHHASFDQIGDISQGGIRRGFSDFCPL